MPHVAMPAALAAMTTAGAIRADDVAVIRKTVYGDGSIGPDEAGWLFALEAGAADRDPAFDQLFCEAITDYLVWQAAPEGYVSEENADWLIARIGQDGIVGTRSELELLIRVLEAARSAPARLSAYALTQVKAAVVDGTGPLASGHLEPGVIGRAEVELIRRILYAFAGDAAIGVSREEAEVLFDLNDRTREADNHPAWSDLFVKAVANFLMAARGYTPPPRAEALRREAWVDSETPGVAGMFSGMMSGLLSDGLKGIWRSYTQPDESVAAARNDAFAADVRASETLTADEVRWLADRIGRDGVIHENERALIAFLREESPDIHPSLQTLIDTAA